MSILNHAAGTVMCFFAAKFHYALRLKMKSIKTFNEKAELFNVQKMSGTPLRRQNTTAPKSFRLHERIFKSSGHESGLFLLLQCLLKKSLNTSCHKLKFFSCLKQLLNKNCMVFLLSTAFGLHLNSGTVKTRFVMRLRLSLGKVSFA